MESGEDYEEAFNRETREELSLNTKMIPYRLLGSLNPKEHDVSAYMKVYEIKMDKVPDFNKDDFIEYFWLTPKALLERLNRGDKSKDDLPKLVKIFYRNQL